MNAWTMTTSAETGLRFDVTHPHRGDVVLHLHTGHPHDVLAGADQQAEERFRRHLLALSRDVPEVAAYRAGIRRQQQTNDAIRQMELKHEQYDLDRRKLLAEGESGKDFAAKLTKNANDSEKVRQQLDDTRPGAAAFAEHVEGLRRTAEAALLRAHREALARARAEVLAEQAKLRTDFTAAIDEPLSAILKLDRVRRSLAHQADGDGWAAEILDQAAPSPVEAAELAPC